MKNVLFPKVITIFKLTYLFWFSMEQTSSRIWHLSLHVGFPFGMFSQLVSRELCYLAETIAL